MRWDRYSAAVLTGLESCGITEAGGIVGAGVVESVAGVDDGFGTGG